MLLTLKAAPQSLPPFTLATEGKKKDTKRHLIEGGFKRL
jgi:hypothetical protein